MFKAIGVSAILLGLVGYAGGATRSIGTASARGDVNVDNYAVQGNATLFDGSVVQTGQASADLRLASGADITMASDSRGKLYQNRIVLEQGSSEVKASGPFQLEAYGLRVIPSSPASRGVVALHAGHTVEVSALTGAFGVRNEQGVLLASVHPGSPLNFSIQAAGGGTVAGESNAQFSDVGMISSQGGHYYLVDETGAKYELTGKDVSKFGKFVGDKAVITGTEVPGAGGSGVAGTVSVNKITLNGPGYMSDKEKILISAAIIGAGVGASIGLNATNSTALPASR